MPYPSLTLHFILNDRIIDLSTNNKSPIAHLEKQGFLQSDHTRSFCSKVPVESKNLSKNKNFIKPGEEYSPGGIPVKDFIETPGCRRWSGDLSAAPLVLFAAPCFIRNGSGFGGQSSAKT